MGSVVYDSLTAHRLSATVLALQDTCESPNLRGYRWNRTSLVKKEVAWPEYKDTASLLLFPQYMTRDNMSTAFPAQGRQRRIAPVVSRTAEVPASLSDVEEEGRLWQVQHQRHAQNVQEHKLHHIHILNETTGERMPLTHCRRVDNPKLCKADFPVPNG